MARRNKNSFVTPLDAGSWIFEVKTLKVLDDVKIPGAWLDEEEDVIMDSYYLTLFPVKGKKLLSAVKAVLKFNVNPRLLTKDGDLKKSCKQQLAANRYGFDTKLDCLDREIGLDDEVKPGNYMASVVGKRFTATVEPQQDGFVRLVFIGEMLDLS